MSSEPTNKSATDEIDIEQSLIKLRKRLHIMVLAIAIGAGIGLGYTKIVTPRWQARATIYFPTKAPTLLGIGGLGDNAAMDGGAAAILGGVATPIKIFRGFLESERTLDEVTAGTGLSRKDVEDMRRFDEETGASTLTVFAEDRKADLAKQVVALHVKSLTAINAELSIGSAQDDVRVLNAKLRGERVKLTAADDRLTAFKKRAVTAPTATTATAPGGLGLTASGSSWAQQLKQAQVKLDGVNAVLNKQRATAERANKESPYVPSDLPPAAKYRPQLVEAEYDLALKEKTLGPDDPTVIDAKNRINLLRAKLKSEMSAYLKAVRMGVVEPGSSRTMLPTDTGTETANMTLKVGLEAQIEALRQLADKSPVESDTLTRLTLEVTIQTAIVEQLSEQATIAKIQADRDPNRWTLLDPPRIDEKPVNKKFSRNGALGAIVGLIAGLWLSSRSKGSQA